MHASLPFMKMHGLGNDFVVVDGRDGAGVDDGLARAMADRHRGVGFDQLARIDVGQRGADLHLVGVVAFGPGWRPWPVATVAWEPPAALRAAPADGETGYAAALRAAGLEVAPTRRWSRQSVRPPGARSRIF